MEITVGLVGEFGKRIVAPIKRRVIYLCCFNNNVESLIEEAKKLAEERDKLKMEVDIAKDNEQMIDFKVEAWLEEVYRFQQHLNELQTKITNIQDGGCLSVKSRYSANKIAVKMAETVKQIRENRPDIIVLRYSTTPNSSIRIEQHMMEIWNDKNSRIVGICGMGGVGKTILVEKIKNRVMKENVFDEAVMVAVGYSANKKKIQGEIAEKLGLKLEETSLSDRAQRLGSRLRGGKRILIILDDVWKPLDLEELGIPCESRCTVVLTSRVKSVVDSMDARPSYVLETLTREEAWSLLKEKMDTPIDDQNEFSSLTQGIVNECNGLPLALVCVAGVLKDEKNIEVWEDALRQLRSSKPEELPFFLKDVYAPIKLSYDHLSRENAKSIFFLCSLFPQDFDIPLEHLAVSAMGLRMFEGSMDLEQARDVTKTLVGMLKSRSLLFKGRDEGHVKMHDIIRDVAIFIASKERWQINSGDNSTWISTSVQRRSELSKGSTFPNLDLLLIDNSAEEELQINNIPFEGMQGLNVVFVNYDYSMTSLPHATSSLKNLRTLILRKCSSLKSLCAVGEFTNLEVLYCQDCSLVQELPVEIGGLSRLKLLHISDCESLKTIAAGVLSRLIELEELTLLLGSSECPHKERCSFESLTSSISFKNLKRIEITSWWMLELVLWNKEQNGNQRPIIFPKLEKLELHHLSRFTPLCKGIEFPLLTRMEIFKFPNDQDDSLHVFCKAEDVADDVMAERKGLIKDFPKEETNDSIHEMVADNNTSVFPNLRFLLINNGPYSGGVTEEFPFESTWQLHELFITHCALLLQLPHQVCLLKNLRKLVLESCESLEDISVVGELVSLEILICQDCGSLKELPCEIGRLDHLKLLHISDCKNLEAVKAGVISNLTRLEELTLIGSFQKWQLKVERGKNAALCELNSLTSLTILRIVIEDASLAAEQINLSSNLVEFSIRIGNPSFHTSTRCAREIQLVLETDFILGDWIYKLVENTESLVLQGKGSTMLVSLLPKCQSLKRLLIQNAKMTRLSDGATTVFPALESLCLKDIDDIEEIHIGPISSHCFKNLQEITLESLPKLQHFWNVVPHFINLSSIYINQCCSLRSVLPRVMGNNYLLHLRSLTIWSCSMLEQLVMWEEEDGRDIVQTSPHLTFPELEKLELHDLPRLTSLCKGIECPLLTRLEIVKCPHLKILDSPSTNNYDSLLLFWEAEDVVDDVAISITEQNGLIKSFPRERTNDSIRELATHNITSAFPNIRFLMIDNGAEEFSFHNDLHETPRKYDLLYIGHCIFISLLSHKIHLLKNVRKLILESCVSVKDISVVGEMESLVVLSCQRCGSIKELPVEIARLSKLKLLRILDCESLETVAAGALSKLTGLEELTLIRSFKKWADGKNATLSELSYLSSLTTLRIEIEDASLAAEQFRLPNLEKFYVRIGHPSALFHTSRRYGRDMQLVLEGDFILGDWIHQLLRSTESLALQGEGSSKLVSQFLPEFHGLKGLILENAKMTRLIDGRLSDTTSFPELEYLGLKDIDDIEEIHNGPISSDSFMNLQEIVLVCLPKLQRLWNLVPPSLDLSSIHIAKCDSLHNLFPLAIAGNYLLRLQRIRIRSRSTLEQVVFRNEEENGQSRSRRMGKLQFLDLYDLRRFTSLYKGIENIHFTFSSQRSQPTVTQLRN